MKISPSHGLEPASSWVQRWSHLIKPQGVVLDVACGRGRHAYWFYQRVGKPSRPDFLLRTGELLQMCNGLCIVAFEDGFRTGVQGQSPRYELA